MTKTSLRTYATVALASAAIGALAACQTVPSGGSTDGQEARFTEGAAILDACVASRCGTLDLDYQDLRDFSELAALDHVDVLMASNTSFAELSDVGDVSRLTELHIGYTQIRDISGLPAFSNLTVLHAQNTNFDDYTPIGELSRLRELAVGGPSLTDLSFLRQIRSLRELKLDGAYNLTDLSGLEGHRGLRVVQLDGTNVTDLTPLLSLPNLQRVSLGDYGDPETQAQVEALRAQGVEVFFEPVIIVC